tara:strand:- start:13593 stop:14165 length:573 start_codon:yes stop_codon:yes gene_type:complete
MDKFRGRISSSGFSSGERVVVGDWYESPLGEFTNIMWARPDGTRILMSPSKAHADYVSSLYTFEEINVVPIDIERQKRGVSVNAGDLSVSMTWSRGLSFPIPRPLWFISTVEHFFANLFFGTKTFGHACNGLREWYCIQSLSKLNRASASNGKYDFGKMSDFQTSACFGFSDPPKKPSSVRVNSIIENKN